MSSQTDALAIDIFAVHQSKKDLDRRTEHPRFDLTGVRTHDLHIMTVHFMVVIRPS